MDWDRIRIFLEVARAGQILGAAKRLEVNHTTVARQITALEKELHTKLIDRRSTGSLLTPAGAALFVAAEKAESEFLRVSAQVASSSHDLAGTVRIGAPDGLGTYFLADKLGAFAAAHASLLVQLVPVPRTFSLSKREVDLVITLERPVEGRLVCAKLTDYTLSVYGAKSYLAQRLPINCLEDLAHHLLVTYISDFLYSRALDYGSALKHVALRRYECGSAVGQIEAVRAGHGVGILHDYAARKFPELQRILPDTWFKRSYWLVSHKDTRDTPRIRKVHAYLTDQIRHARRDFVPQGLHPV